MCRGFNSERLAAELVKRGVLRPGPGSKSSRPERLPGMQPGKKRRVYVLDAGALFGDEADFDGEQAGHDHFGGVLGVPCVPSEVIN